MMSKLTDAVHAEIKILRSSFKSTEHIQKKEHGPFFEILALQASCVTLITPDDESVFFLKYNKGIESVTD